MTTATDREVTKQLRGSSLLLVGRILALGMNLVVQVATIRYLTKADYGAFAYALSLVTTGSTLITLGLDRAITRFVPIYDERREYDKLAGTILLQVGTIVVLGAAAVVAVVGFQGFIGRSLIDDDRTVSVLLILVALAPVLALDGMMLGLFAVFARARAIFFRRHVLTPLLRVAVVAILIVGGLDARFLAAGYVATGIAGLAVYAVLLRKVARQRGLLDHLRAVRPSVPYREVFAFALPLLSNDVLFMLLNTLDALLLGRYGGAEDVAAYKVVLPVAKLNQLVLLTFGMLFTPLAARLFARGDRAGISRLYWQTAAWVAVTSFPVFALTTSLAPTLTETLFGARYRDSWPYLALVGFGYYFSAALGFNATTLKVLGRVRYIVVVSLAAGAVNTVLNLVLIPRHGPLGAAIASCVTLVVFNVLNQAGLRGRSGIGVFSRQHARIYVAIAASAGALALIQATLHPGIALDLALAAAASLAVFAIGRAELDIAETFPEVARLPVLGRLLVGHRSTPR